MPQSKNGKSQTPEVTVEVAPAKYRIRLWEGEKLIKEEWVHSRSMRNIRVAAMGADPKKIKDLEMT